MAADKDFANLYGQAYAAYGQGNYEEAAHYIEQMAEVYPDDPNVLLLQGHIAIGLEQYATAQQKYGRVLELSDRPDLLDCAQQALEQIRELTPRATGSSPAFSTAPGANADLDFDQWQAEEEEWEQNLEGLNWDSAVFNDEDLGEPTLGQGEANSTDNPFVLPARNTSSFVPEPSSEKLDWHQSMEIDWNPDVFAEDEFNADDEKTLMPEMGASTFVVPGATTPPFEMGGTRGGGTAASRDEGVPTFQPWLEETEQADLNSLMEPNNVPTVQSSPNSAPSQSLRADFPGSFETFGGEDLDNLGDFDLTDIAPELPDSSLFTQTGSDLGMSNDSVLGEDSSPTLAATSPPPGMVTWLKPEEGNIPGELGGGSSRFVKPTVEIDPGWLGWFTNAPLKRKQWYMAIATGITTTLTIGIVNGVAGIFTPAVTSSPAKNTAPRAEQKKEAPKPKTSEKNKNNKAIATTIPPAPQHSPIALISLLTGLTSFAVPLLISNILVRQVRQTIDDLQNQFDAIYEGNFNVRAKVRSEDELGQLSQRFNYISQVILTATSEAQERAAATEKAREKLQRQVIRLLDDVEGASRGDLTVQAEVTADELGAVADAFNLTIQNLREIVLQVKKAAKQVNRNCTDSESFARNNSSDALRMAEELAVTLNSVQLMTESIQRVAENAREAEEVAHTSSLTALKGGEAVERTVGGILQIRETVSETARKVKRLAEASQEISKIVAVISQIASRTNLLALNASIQAARAGEAGRGFAIVADEVRQLADRSAKSLKEIEQIVLQIQSETGSVMTAMEEGIQQVIDVTDKSEQSKRSLEDIIEVSNRINTLVRSITADTVKQQDNSGAVAQVMQSIELTAQETSQESQRVAGSLQTLVSISRDLLTSVERFRLEKGTK